MSTIFFDIDAIADKLFARLETKLSGLQPAKQYTDDLSDIIGSEQAAELLGVSRYTLYGYIYHNQIPVLPKKGRKVYFSRRALAEWLRAGKPSKTK